MACAHDENLFRPATNFHRNVTLSFVIPTACNFFDFAQTRLLSEGRTVVERIGVPPPQQPPCPLTTVLSVSTTLPFVIPSEAEGSAVRFIGDKSQLEASPFLCHPERTRISYLTALTGDRACGSQ